MKKLEYFRSIFKFQVAHRSLHEIVYDIQSYSYVFLPVYTLYKIRRHKGSWKDYMVYSASKFWILYYPCGLAQGEFKLSYWWLLVPLYHWPLRLYELSKLLLNWQNVLWKNIPFILINPHVIDYRVQKCYSTF